MNTLVQPGAADTSRADDDDLVHDWCCDENVALCGADLTDAPVIPDPTPDEMCVVCVDLLDADCVVTCRSSP